MPSKEWDEEDSDSSSAPENAPATTTQRRKFEDEEDDSDVLESWDAAEDSEVEREKERKATEAKAAAAAAAAASKKSKAERIAEHQAARAKARVEGEETDEEEEETEAERRERLRRTEKEADLRHAEDLLGDFGNIGISNSRKAKGPTTVISIDGKDGNNTVDLATLPVFNPATKLQFEQLRNTLVPVLTASAKKAHYALFLQEFSKQLAADLPSDQIKKIASTLTTLSNEKMKAEKAADKGGKKSKAAKTKTSLVASRTGTTDTNTYEDEAFGDDDFM